MKLLRKGTAQLQQKKSESEKNLRNYAFLPSDELYSSMSAKAAGLTAEQVEERQDEYGKNIITTGKNNTVLHRLKESVINPFS